MPHNCRKKRNLILDKSLGKPEPFGAGKRIVQRFKGETDATECRHITNKIFSDWTDFQNHIESSAKCKGLTELAITEASDTIERLKEGRKNGQKAKGCCFG